MTTTLKNYVYAKFLKHQHNLQYNIHSEMFIQLKKKGKGLIHPKATFMNKEGTTTFISLKSRLFKNSELEQGKVYGISIVEMGTYMNNDYIKSIVVKPISESKSKTLLEKFDNIPQIDPDKYNLESSDESDESEEEVLHEVEIQPKKKRKRKLI